MSTLYFNGVIHSFSDPYATALLVEDGLVAWLGADDTAERRGLSTGSTGSAAEVVDLNGALVTPAFVDSWSTAPAASAEDGAAHGVFLTAGPASVDPAPGEHAESEDQVMIRYGDRATEPFLDQSVRHGRPDGAGLAVAVSGTGGARPAVTQTLETLEPASASGVQVVLVPDDAEAAEAVVEALRELGERLGSPVLGRARHRLVWNGPLAPDRIEVLAALGVSVTLVPDADGRITAPVSALLSAGVPVSWGSGESGPDPWGAVRAMLSHPDPDQRISARAGFTAATRSGLRVLPAAAIDPLSAMAGRITPSAPATFAVWDVESLSVQAPDGRVAAWSTDARAGTPLLPVLDDQTPSPRLLATVAGGTVRFRAPDFA